ncbi:ubiquitin carboxyl-terminal hydrolase 37-like [Anguilla anguilla]|uniref:ubiquitin carboxyl-terminal hydrolase 37-like n=1 Tax=Anguilla anguilla TaxID=7936 RepID=UPI0015AC8C60|nr:ubiquitin carboxyl-terminal hydrolase 37-like [Anguilla anguilla]
MNATLQSLFSLQIFSQDIRGEEGCWRSNLTALLKCLADLHSARASHSRQKISLLKTLKQTIATNFSDFCGTEQQDAHEFLSVLLSQLKEEGVSLRTREGLHPYTCSIEANFEFDLLTTRTCLSCGEKVRRTESYNCLSVDLVPGGSVQDSLALYFKGYEVECRCQWCSGQLATVEPTLQSLPRVLVVQLKRFSFNSRGNLVKLHDRLHISPQLSLQVHSTANVRLPGTAKPHLTHGDFCETYPSPGGAVPFAE